MNKEIEAIKEQQDPAYSNFYNEYHSIADYSTTYFHKLDHVKALIKTTENALSIGLRSELLMEYLTGSSVWEVLKYKEKEKILQHFKVKINNSNISGFHQIYIPGPIHIVESLNSKYRFRTIPDISSDKENIYYFNGQIYQRAEEVIKTEAHKEYIRQWSEMMENATNAGDMATIKRLTAILNAGPSANQINEVMQMIRRTTFCYDPMNPTGYTPFLNGLLNLKTKKLEAFNPELFYTFQINAKFLTDQYITLKDTPLFRNLLTTAFYYNDIPTVLSYFSYTLYPDLPAHKTLFILGRDRIGKGTSIRILQGLMPSGSGSISLPRLLTSDRFTFTGIEGKNLLTDSETKRKFRRGTVLEWSAFCNLFGGDTLNVEPKGHEAHDYISKAKGIFLGNLPFIPVDSPPAIARILVVETRNEKPKKVIKELEHKILDAEGDQIATLLMQILFKLIARDFEFPGQLPDEATSAIMDQLADPVQFFIDEETEEEQGAAISVDDAYNAFIKWCKNKGIPYITRQTFSKKFGYTYKKKLQGPRNKRVYVFTDCLVYNDEDVNKNPGKDEHDSESSETLKIMESRERYLRIRLQYFNPFISHLRRSENHKNQETLDPANPETPKDLAKETCPDNRPLNMQTTQEYQKLPKIPKNPKMCYYKIMDHFDSYPDSYFDGSDIILDSYRPIYHKNSSNLSYILLKVLIPENLSQQPGNWMKFLSDSQEISQKAFETLSRGDAE